MEGDMAETTDRWGDVVEEKKGKGGGDMEDIASRIESALRGAEEDQDMAECDNLTEEDREAIYVRRLRSVGVGFAREKDLPEEVAQAIRSIVSEQLTGMPALETVKTHRFRITARLKKPSKNAGMATCKAISLEARQRYGCEDEYDVTVNLCKWCAATPTVRAARVFSALLDATGRVKVSEHKEVVEHFGLQTAEQGALVVAALAHSETMARIEEWEVDRFGQLLMFADRVRGRVRSKEKTAIRARNEAEWAEASAGSAP